MMIISIDNWAYPFFNNCCDLKDINLNEDMFNFIGENLVLVNSKYWQTPTEGTEEWKILNEYFTERNISYIYV